MAGLATFSVTAMASEVGAITTFSDGNVLTAAELNDNNTAIITAVNDNNSQITINALSGSTNSSDIGDHESRIAAIENENIALQAQVTALQAVVDAWTYSVGETGPAGGLVFYISDGGLHGLEVSPDDLDDGSGAEWGCDGVEVTGAEGITIGTGAQNTTDILAGCSDADTAAKLAKAYNINGSGDWFLPSPDEAYELYQQKSVMSSSSDWYWTSAETSDTTAKVIKFTTGQIYPNNTKSSSMPVRAVSAF